MKIIKHVKFNQNLSAFDLTVFNANNADAPESNKAYTIKSAFFHEDKINIKKSKWAFHFEELNHGSLVGYDAKYFVPVDEQGHVVPKNEAQFVISKKELKVSIRPMAESDIQECIEIMRQNVSRSDLQQVAEELSAMFKPTKFIAPYFLVAEENGFVLGLMGFSNCGFDDGVFGLFSANVNPLYQNRGIGRLLLNACIEKIKYFGGEELFLTTREIKFAEKFGFKNIGERGDGYFLMRLCTPDSNNI